MGITKVMKPITIFSVGVHMIIYIDKILLMAESVDHARAHLNSLMHLLYGLGFIINQSKSVTSAQQLSLQVDLTHLSLPGVKVHCIREEVGQMLQKLQVRHLAQIMGNCMQHHR